MNWDSIVSQLDPPHHVWFQDTFCFLSKDQTTAIIACPSEACAQFIDQLYFLTMIYPIIKKEFSFVQHLRIVHGSIYDLVKTEDAIIVSFQ